MIKLKTRLYKSLFFLFLKYKYSRKLHFILWEDRNNRRWGSNGLMIRLTIIGDKISEEWTGEGSECYNERWVGNIVIFIFIFIFIVIFIFIFIFIFYLLFIFLKRTCRGYPLCLLGGGVGLLLIRSWVLGNEAHENRNGVLLFLYREINILLYERR